jgi:hypothetical protein
MPITAQYQALLDLKQQRIHRVCLSFKRTAQLLLRLAQIKTPHLIQRVL